MAPATTPADAGPAEAAAPDSEEAAAARAFSHARRLLGLCRGANSTEQGGALPEGVLERRLRVSDLRDLGRGPICSVRGCPVTPWGGGGIGEGGGRGGFPALFD